MDNELIKELENAKFPFQEHNFASNDMGFDWCESCQLDYDECKAVPCEPTLSELIEACGGRFASFFAPNTTGSGECEEWIADSKNAKTGSGATPEEAVAWLYIALQSPTPPLKETTEGL